MGNIRLFRVTWYRPFYITVHQQSVIIQRLGLLYFFYRVFKLRAFLCLNQACETVVDGIYFACRIIVGKCGVVQSASELFI